MLSRFEIEQLLSTNSPIAKAMLLDDLVDCANAHQSEYLYFAGDEPPAWWAEFGFSAVSAWDGECEVWKPVPPKDFPVNERGLWKA